MADKVKPLKLEDTTSGTQLNFAPKEVDPTEDYVAAKGLAIENLDTHLIDRSGNDIQFTDPTVGTKSVDDVQSTARVSANDTTPDNLLGKLAAGTGVTLTELNDGGDESLEISIAGQESKLNQAQFFGQGNTGNKWLALGSSSKTSDDVPYIIIHDVDLVGFTWSNDDATVDVDIEVYKNGTSPGDIVATYNITDKTVAKSNITDIAFSHGDRVSVFVDRNGGASNSSTDPVFALYFQITTETNSEVST